MLAGYYGVWRNGKEVTERWRNRETLHSFPEGASLTKYGDGQRLELFGKLSAPIRRGGILIEQDEVFDLFLIVRSGPGGHGRIVRQWRFRPKEMLLSGDRFDPSILQRSTRNAVERAAVIQQSGSYRFHLVDAYLDVDREKEGRDCIRHRPEAAVL